MARPREFDPETVIDKAMHVFWEHGYDGASLPELLTRMGLTRGSFYKAFGHKKALFLTVIDRYDLQEVTNAVDLLSDDTHADGRARIIQIFTSICDAVARGDKRGCLLCSASAGPSGLDLDVAASVNTGLNRMQDGFATALAASPAHAQLDADTRHALANALTTQYVGLRILARSAIPLPALSQAVDAVQVMLNQGRT